MFLTEFRGVGESGLGFSKGRLFLGGSSRGLRGSGWAWEDSALGKSRWAWGWADPSLAPRIPRPPFRSIPLIPPTSITAADPSPPEPQGHKLTPTDQARAPPDPQGRVGAKGPLLVLPPMAQVDLQLCNVTAGIPGVPPK